jgi:hypothetical protein
VFPHSVIFLSRNLFFLCFRLPEQTLHSLNLHHRSPRSHSLTHRLHLHLLGLKASIILVHRRTLLPDWEAVFLQGCQCLHSPRLPVGPGIDCGQTVVQDLCLVQQPTYVQALYSTNCLLMQSSRCRVIARPRVHLTPASVRRQNPRLHHHSQRANWVYPHPHHR